MSNYMLYCIVFISYSLHRHYIKFALQEYVIILVTMHEMTKMHNSYSAQVTMLTEKKKMWMFLSFQFTWSESLIFLSL